MKRFIVLSALLAGSLVAFPFDAAGGDGGVLILSKNPQLSKIPDWPKGTGVGEPTDCNKSAMQDSLDNMRKLGETAYRCLPFEGSFGGQPWESGSGESGLYHLQLHPNSPMVWRVFKRDKVRLIALIAEFDTSGKLLFSQSARSPTSLLADARGTGSQAPQASQNVTGGERRKGETFQECIERLRGSRESTESRSKLKSSAKGDAVACGATGKGVLMDF